MKKVIGLIGAAMFLALPMVAGAVGGLVGDCVDCHTMHNSENGLPVAVKGLSDTETYTPIENLLRMDCVACHAADPTGDKIVNFGGGSTVPQVMHGDATGDLAGGNFQYIADLGDHKGHNVVDLVDAEPYDGLQDFATPPGKYRADTHAREGLWGTSDVDPAFDRLTCAGNAGCHGTRNQASSWTDDGTVDPADNVTPANVTSVTRLRGLAAISGAHHNSEDGLKNPSQIAAGKHDGAEVAAGYRFIPGLKGFGVGSGTDAATTTRWQNSAASHNEYFGSPAQLAGGGCSVCHLEGGIEVGSHLETESKIKVPNQSMSGFCTTCHGAFHSVGDVDGNGTSDNQLDATSADGDHLGTGENGVSGAFLRHPSDYVIPNSGEYSYYQTYALSAPVARQDLDGLDGTSTSVTPGDDMVMCLSCHMAHASEFDYMLRFDYTLQSAGNAAALDQGTGCLACHTTKGVLPGAAGDTRGTTFTP